mgnify:FL=1|tara:strand:- start:11 stop:316 length:306 start_codon:yes stop_codon:yes gene_type:complete
MEKAITEARIRTPEEKIWIAIIQQAFNDAFELGAGHNISMLDVSQARNWFYTRACAEACDHVGTTRDHIQKLYDRLNVRYKAGLLTKDEIRFAIRRLEWKI